MVKLAGCVLLFMSAIALPSWAKPVEFLPRTENWNVVYADDRCDLGASFGSGKNKILLVMTRFAPGDGFHLMIGGDTLRAWNLHTSVSVDFGPFANPQPIESINGTAGSVPVMDLGYHRLDDLPENNSFQLETPVVTPTQEAAVTSLTLTVKGKQIGLKLGSMSKPMDAMRACTDDLIKSWGYDLRQQQTLSRNVKPKTDSRHWLKSEDYPANLLAKGKSAMIDFRLDIDEQGLVSNCHILRGAGDKIFADLTCKALSHKKFDPAFDAGNKPVRSFYVNRVNFVAG